ncbi:hypothetical protein TSOC_006126 [Tetrabaena socialis]|uniref:phytol kinase n=1 Tax=Tetrabaena socialis TaxID=47790 RepID=A0A2J8A4G7_9CHLO|nr:hypothetical protein TSOC_006126 [Tetrabaena socialis]|eukprot:PNH07420.1 hypothetical protein TSOC_006126 [Tetrabaena socialis]
MRLSNWLAFQGCSATTWEACEQRLLPTGLAQSLDCLLRRLAAAGLQNEDEHGTVSICFFLLTTTLPLVLCGHVAAPPACGGGHGGSVWRPQDDLGLLVSAVKLGRREAEQSGGVTLVPNSSDVLAAPPAQSIATGLATLAMKMVKLLAGLTQQRQRGNISTTMLGRTVEAEVALREAIALASVAALPILERIAVRDLRRLVALAAAVALMVHCLAAAVQLLPLADVLALQPQRTLALLGRLLQRAHDLRQLGTGRGSRGGGRGGGGRRSTSDGGRFQEDELPAWADEVARALVHMAADEQLVGAVAGWLRGEAAALPQPAQAGALVVHPQGLCGDLDTRALAAAVRHWNAAAADSIERLHAAAASSAPAGAVEMEGGGGSSSSRGSGAAARGSGATAPLLAAARAATALRHETALWGLRDGGARGYPSWPSRVLRLCGNPACRNFAGPAEADLPLRKCSGCKAVRYCGVGCQGQHWREGGHREACARLRAVTQAVRGGG